MPATTRPPGVSHGSQARRLDLPQRVAQVLGDARGRRSSWSEASTARDRLAVERELSVVVIAGAPPDSSERDRAVGQLASAGRHARRASGRCRAPTVTPSPSTAPPATMRAARRCARPAATMQSRSAQPRADLGAVEHDRALDRRARADRDAVAEHDEAADVRARGDRARRARRRAGGTTRPVDLDAVGDREVAVAQALARRRSARCPRGCRRCPAGSARACRCRASSASAGKP